MWTQFMDMHSGGGLKAKPYEYIYIEADEARARRIFAVMFTAPDNVTCDCCGEDYSVTESPTLEQATAYNRGCRWDSTVRSWVEEPDTRYIKDSKVVALDEYVTRPDVLVLRAPDFTTP